MYDKQTAKKGSEEVISLVAIHTKKEVAPGMKQMTLHCDRCVEQSWNNILRGTSNDSWWGAGVSSHLAPDNKCTTSLVVPLPAHSNLLLNLWSNGSCYEQQEAANWVPQSCEQNGTPFLMASLINRVTIPT